MAQDELQRLLDIMAALRDPDTGCPWDIEQTFVSIAPYTLEEAYEVVDAIERDAPDDLRDELGDLLLQVVFHSQMAAEAGLFSFGDVATAIADKMQRRHPHVFGDTERGSAAQQQQAWEAHKRAEQSAAGKPAHSVLDNLTPNLPALTLAAKTGRRAAQTGFDWDNADQVIAKVEEELAELKQARAAGDPAHIAEELGDLLLATTSLARHLNVDPEQALRNANRKFSDRFRALEQSLADEGLDWQDLSLEQLEARWQANKRR